MGQKKPSNRVADEKTPKGHGRDRSSQEARGKRVVNVPTTHPVPAGSDEDIDVQDDSTSALLAEIKQSASCKQFKIADIRAATKDFSESEVLGAGHFAVVYRGVDLSGKRFAIKRLKRFAEPGSADYESLKQEVKILGQLSHKNVVKLHGYCFAKNEQILVYELADGGSLEDLMKGPDGKGCQLFLKQRVQIALHVAEALEYLHSMGIIHRDIKPANILLSPSMDAKVADFGLLKILDPKNEYTVTMLAGTFGYMDPVAMRSGRTNFLTDVFALGITLLGLISGRPPAVTDEEDLEIVVRGEEQLRQQQLQQKREREKRRLERERKQREKKAGKGNSTSLENGCAGQGMGNSEPPEDWLKLELEAVARLHSTGDEDLVIPPPTRVFEKPTVMALRRWTAQMQRFGELRSFCDPFLRQLIDMEDCSLALDPRHTEVTSPGSKGSRDRGLKRRDIKAIEACVELGLKCTDDDGSVRDSISSATARLKEILDSIPSIDKPGFAVLTTSDIVVLLGNKKGLVNEGDFSPHLELGRDPWRGDYVVIERAPMPPAYIENMQGDPAAAFLDHLRRASDFRHTGLLQLLGACPTPKGAFLVYRMPKDHVILDTKLFGSAGETEAWWSEGVFSSDDGADGHFSSNEPKIMLPPERQEQTRIVKGSLSPEGESKASVPSNGQTRSSEKKPRKVVAQRFSHELSALHLSAKWQEKAKLRASNASAVGEGDPSHSSTSTPLSLRRRISAALGVAMALQYLHERGYVHGNIHVGRVMTSASGECMLIGMGGMSFLPVTQKSSSQRSDSYDQGSGRSLSGQREGDQLPQGHRSPKVSSTSGRVEEVSPPGFGTKTKPDLHISVHSPSPRQAPLPHTPDVTRGASDETGTLPSGEKASNAATSLLRSSTSSPWMIEEAQGGCLDSVRRPAIELANSSHHTPRQMAFMRFGVAPPLNLDSLSREQMRALRLQQMEDVFQFGNLVLSIASDRGPLVDGWGDLALTSFDPLPDSMSLKDWIGHLVDSRQLRHLLEACATTDLSRTFSSPHPKASTPHERKNQENTKGKSPGGGEGECWHDAGVNSGELNSEGKEWHALEALLILGLQCLRIDLDARPSSSEIVSRLRAMVDSLDGAEGIPGKKTSRLRGSLSRLQGARREVVE